jgi:hypothetical protein
MTDVDVRSAMAKWFSDGNARWRSRSITTDLQVASDIDKAIAVFETPTHAGTITAWGGVEQGTIELIVMDLATKAEEIRNEEYSTTDELRTRLDTFAEAFLALAAR